MSTNLTKNAVTNTDDAAKYFVSTLHTIFTNKYTL